MAKVSLAVLSTLTWIAYGLETLMYPEAQLPIVDLGYGLHQASFNVCLMLNTQMFLLTPDMKLTGSYYNFSNIRYAEPPLQSLRFAAPVSPKGRNRIVDNGSVARICPQAYPKGAFTNQIYNTHYSLTGQTNLEDFQNATQGFDYPRNTPQDPRATEDCLFLDVMVPSEIFHKYASKTNRPGAGAAVMVWIHGGGYVAGTKYDTPPAGLISRSQSSGKQGVIYVALNYRLYGICDHAAFPR
jgi:cholinesterase